MEAMNEAMESTSVKVKIILIRRIRRFAVADCETVASS